DGTKTRAEKVYVDPYVDVAVIRYDQPGNDALPAELGCNDRPGVGHPIGAFGHPFGLNFTGTRGVVSGRTSRLGPAQLQIDAPVNGGNSGGPVISMVSGKVIGIRSEEHTSELQSRENLVCRLLLEKKKKKKKNATNI